MTKKYLSLDEAAKILGIPQEELVRLREKGDIRGFADRGTWKFKQDDVESLGRRRQVDSNPEVPIYDSGEVSEQPTVIRREKRSEETGNFLASEGTSASDSDSDVRLVSPKDATGEFGVDSGSDSDVRLHGYEVPNISNLGTDPELPIVKSGSDSDVKLFRPGSDSDVKITLGGADSDSDVQLVGGGTDFEISPLVSEGGTDNEIPLRSLDNSDSDVRLAAPESPVEDVTLLHDDDDALAIDFNPEEGSHASVLDDESGISLGGGDSSILLGESGISLSGPSDSGIGLDLADDDDEGLTLALDGDSGITLDAGESGISLEEFDSGISLSPGGSGVSSRGPQGTMPMMDIMGDFDDDQTNLEMPTLNDGHGSESDMTGVMDIQDGGDDVFTLDGGNDTDNHFDAEDVDLEGEEFEEDPDLDVFDAGEDAFEGAGEGSFVASSAGRAPHVEAEWGTITFVGLTVASVLLLVCGAVMIDLVKHTATSNGLNPVSGKLIEMLGGTFKG